MGVGPYLGAGGLAGKKQSGACSAREGKPKSLPNGAADQHSQQPILQSLGPNIEQLHSVAGTKVRTRDGYLWVLEGRYIHFISAY